ncbi:MAG: outer membrane lipoprotein carrier protein LolA [Akkermansiaceae bacterium]|nr:outer membrane lipoprotein carrier protein LolA [Verrucomicrobiales bacterium]
MSVCSLFSPSLFAAEFNPLLTSWLSAQTNFQTWSADFVQTRTLKSLTQPLTAKGHVWFSEPNRFRWELGHPPQTIAVRAKDEMLVISPRLKHVERYSLAQNQAGPWRDAMALIEAGFPRSQADLEARFHIQSQTITNGTCELSLQPKSASARRLMPRIKIAFSTNELALRATELEFADGSTMRNDFTNAVLNPKLDESLFAPKLESDYKIVEPMKAK